MKSLIFHCNLLHSLRFTCHATCPLAQKYYSPRGGTVSTSHFPCQIQNPLVESRAMIDFPCQPHICATVPLGAHLSRDDNQLLFEVLLYESFLKALRDLEITAFH